ncbi:MAG: pantoate--beta-alanine ligase [candidate division Zixibacteria bacterium]|nr:pantoate--beta-alanine ligase [candidate division Zixibacteria bacterium]MDD5427069.1 pantoate--beta-alanine ligase [candidate division Zixibacteria bacterium]
MQTIRSVKKMQAVAWKIAAGKMKSALVPTMGALHDGHLTLIKRARKAADIVIVSVFVNPAQFGPKEDFKRYPRDEKGDLKKIKKAGGNIVFMPKAVEIYPADYETYVSVEKMSGVLEGVVRPGHFRGVTTIVSKLFNITRPDVAVFGMKDYQQAIVIKKMTRDMGYPVEIIIAPTVREEDGLAMSSRNRYLDEIGRWEAVCLFYALRTAQEMVKAGIFDTRLITREMQAVILATSPSAQIDYIAFTDKETLTTVKKVVKNTVCSLAVRLHGVRLIDNMKLK